MENSQIEVLASRATGHVEILLATCNGDRFLRQQIDSLLAQTYPAVSILARDDGSRDTTPAILAEYAAQSPQRLRVLADATPTGSAQGNFLRLMQHTQAPYVAFSDQDDVWLASKLTLSMAAMQELEQRNPPATPLLVFTDLCVVDENLEVQAASMWTHLGIRPASVHRLARLLGQSVATGCTMLLNRPLLQLASRMSPAATMHDRWIALAAAAMGTCAYVEEPTVLYRQHESNVIGAVAPGSSMSAMLTRALDNSGRRAERLRSERQAEAILQIYAADLPAASAEVLRAYLESGRNRSPFRRVGLTLRHGFFRETPAKTAALLIDLAKSQTAAEHPST